jgi:hypothetical protein
MKANSNSETLLRAAERVVLARKELEEAETEFHRLVAEPAQHEVVVGIGAPQASPPPPAGDPTNQAPPVTHRVRKLLAQRGALTFGELYDGVLSGGDATKFAVRSALHKDREKGDIAFDGERYSLKDLKRKPG